MEIQLIILIVALTQTDVTSGQTSAQLSALMGGQAISQTAAFPYFGSLTSAFGKTGGGSGGTGSGLSSLFGGSAGVGGGTDSGLSSLFGGGTGSGLSSLFGGGTGSGLSSLFGGSAGVGGGTGTGRPAGISGLLGGVGSMIGAQYLMERKRKLLKRYIDLYENEGCVDPFDKLPTTWRAMAAKNLMNGCSSPQANLTCMMVQTRVVKPHTMVMQRQLANSPLTQGLSQVNAWKTLSKLGLLGQGRGLAGSLPLMALGSTGPLASSLARITEMAERQGEIRQHFLPLQCQEIHHQMMPSLSMPICCPGPVTIPYGIQLMAMQGRLTGL